MGPYRKAAVFLMFLILSMGTIAHGALADTWSLSGSMSTARTGHTAPLLSDGRVLVSGGFFNIAVPGSGLASAEIFNPAFSI